jgi:hypothetical protein
MQVSEGFVFQDDRRCAWERAVAKKRASETYRGPSASRHSRRSKSQVKLRLLKAVGLCVCMCEAARGIVGYRRARNAVLAWGHVLYCSSLFFFPQKKGRPTQGLRSAGRNYIAFLNSNTSNSCEMTMQVNQRPSGRQ